MSREFEKSYRIRASDEVLKKMNAVLQALDQRMDAVEIVKEAFEQGNRLDVDALLKAITDDISHKSAAMQELLDEVTAGFTPERVLETPEKRFTSNAEQEALVAALADANARIGARATSAALGAHTSRIDNPHGVTAAQVGALTVAESDADLALLEALILGTASPAADTLGKLETLVGNRLRVDAAQALNPAEQGRVRANAGAGVLAGHRDVIINGDFSIWQRGTSVTLIGGGSGSFIADRWRHGGNYSQATVTVSRQAFAPGQVAVPGNPTYYLRYDRSVPGGFNTTVEHRIEGVKTFADSPATVTAYVKGTVGKVINLIITQNFGAGGAPSPSVVAASREVALTSVWKRVDLVADIPSVAGKTLGSNANDYLVLTFDMPAAVGAVTLDIAHVSFVPGDASAEQDPKPPRHVQLDEALCYRYYYRVDGWFGGHGIRYNTAGPIRDAGSLIFPAEMRAVPTALMLTSVVYENCSAAVWDALWKTGANLRVIVTATGIYRALGGAHAFDAEL